MPDNDQSAGAMPVVRGATPPQSYPFGPVWAPYRLPFPGANGVVTPREIGIGFEGEAGAASDSSAGSAGAGSGTDAGGGAGGDAGSSATDDAALGDAGKATLQKIRDELKTERDARKAAEKDRDELRTKTQSESEKAIADAKKAGADEVIGRVHAQVRRAAVREALTAAGALPSLISDLAKADEFAALKVSDNDEIDPKELETAVKAHKARVPDAYKASAAGSADGGSRGGGSGLTLEQIKKMTPEQVNARWAEVEPVLAAQGRA